MTEVSQTFSQGFVSLESPGLEAGRIGGSVKTDMSQKSEIGPSAVNETWLPGAEI